jgi:hypothetical protein
MLVLAFLFVVDLDAVFGFLLTSGVVTFCALSFLTLQLSFDSSQLNCKLVYSIIKVDKSLQHPRPRFDSIQRDPPRYHVLPKPNGNFCVACQ